MQLSIIVPVYNVEPYIERCIESLMQQDLLHKDYEVIIINDGSPDNSRELIVGLQEEYDNIIFIDQDNQGVSVARNNGLVKATGEYILCIDPDDYIAKGTLGSVLKKARLNNLDVLYLGYTIFGTEGQVEYQSDYKDVSERLMTGPELYFKSRGKKVRDPDRSVGILYKREFLMANKLFYPVDVPYLEDGLFLAKTLCLAERCSFDDDLFYQRTTRLGSATHSDLIYSEKARDGFIKAALEIQKLGNEKKLNNYQQSVINQAIAKFVLLPLQSCSLILERSVFIEFDNRLKELNLKILELKGLMPVYRRLVRVYNFSSTVFYYYYIYLSFWKKLKAQVNQIFHFSLIS